MTGKDNPYRNNPAISKDPVVLCSPSGAAYLAEKDRRLFLIVRHGQTDWNAERRLQGREHIPLNDAGKEQAASCGRLFASAKDAGIEFCGFYSSPLGRAVETAESIARAVGEEEVVPWETLIERDYGALSGLTLDERKKLYRSGGPDPDAESVEDAAARMKKALCEISQEIKRDGAAVCVTHAGIINALFSVITCGRLGTGKSFCENCAVSIVVVGRDVTFPVAYGLTGELFIDFIKEYVCALERLRAGSGV
ncbi:MAG: histidine phosphatase family protein [Clostridia bacterium]|nr:histidine phosphatase family protein [Clostridia bacterium]